MYTSGKRRRSFPVKTKRTKKTLKTRKWNFEIWDAASYGIRNPQTWNPESTTRNPESKSLLDYLTWGETLYE